MKDVLIEYAEDAACLPGDIFEMKWAGYNIRDTEDQLQEVKLHIEMLEAKGLDFAAYERKFLIGELRGLSEGVLVLNRVHILQYDP